MVSVWKDTSVPIKYEVAQNMSLAVQQDGTIKDNKVSFIF